MLVLKFHYKTKRFQILKNYYFLGKKTFSSLLGIYSLISYIIYLLVFIQTVISFE